MLVRFFSDTKSATFRKKQYICKDINSMVVCRSCFLAPAGNIERKVRATQSITLPNGKPGATLGLKVTENNRLPRAGKGEKAG